MPLQSESAHQADRPMPVGWRLLWFGGGYVGCAMAGRALSSPTIPWVCFWLPSGLFVAALLWNESKHWPGFVAVAVLSNLGFDLAGGQSLPVGLLFATGNSLEAVVGAWLVRRFVARQPDLSTVREVAGVVGYAALLSTMLSATVGAFTVTTVIGRGSFGATWLLWWSGDALGVLLLSPLLLAWRASARWWWDWRVPGRRLEAAALTAVVFALSLYCFQDKSRAIVAVKYLVIPGVLWAALRFGTRAAGLTCLLVATVAIWLTLHGQTAWGDVDLSPRLQIAALQLYLAVVTLTGLFVAAAIAERRHTEAALQLANERNELAQRAAGSGSWDWDIVTGQIVWSSEMFRLFGLDASADRAGFEAWRGALHPEDRATAEESVAAAVRDHTLLDSDYRIVHRDGQVRWINALGRTTYDAAGQPLRMMGLCIDTTAHRRMEEALRESEANLKALFGATTQTIFLIDLQGTVLAVNEVAARRLGRGPGEMLGTIIYTHLPPEIVAIRRERLAQVVATRQPVRFEDERLGRRIDQTLVPIFDGAGVVARVAVFAEDITERAQAEAQIKEQLQELQRWQGVMLDREDRVLELKREINELCRAAGEAERYLSVEPAASRPAPGANHA